MLNLSLDPPPFGRSSGSYLGRILPFVLTLVIGLAGGFLAGRKSGKIALSVPSRLQILPSAPVDEAASSPVAPRATPAQGAIARLLPPPSGTGAPQSPLVRRIAVTLRGSLEESVAAALPSDEKAWAEELTQVMNRLLVWSLKVAHDGRKGDKIDLLYELPRAQPSGFARVDDAGPNVKEPVVLALHYGSQKLGRVITAYRFKAEGAPFAHYYDKDGVDVEEHLVDSPVAEYEQVTSLLRDGRHHKGVDFKTPVGTPVRAPFDGQILRRNWNFGANGNCLEVLDLASGRHAIFLHL
ncbi:MAG TPA: M23 family metallopeptidase, partial [Anaeromyxobacteraceae bacterium]|nr:M23 family metallopeptidase [Anaeromyxobacteraceae bacterium]